MDFSTNPLVVWFENAVDWAIKNKKIVFGFVAGCIVLSGGVAVYRYSANQTNIAAHKELVALMRMVDEPVHLSGKGTDDLKASMEEQKWQKVAAVAQKNYQEFKSTNMGATFLAVHADALCYLNKPKEAVAVMRQSVDAMGVASVRDYYQLKLALMLVDQAEEVARKEGLDLLTKISNNPKHMAHDRALYYLGEYFWINKQYPDAKNVWQQLIVKYGNEGGASEFIEKAKERLELLVV